MRAPSPSALTNGRKCERLPPATKRNFEAFNQLGHFFPNGLYVLIKEICKSLIEIGLPSCKAVRIAVMNDPPVVLKTKLPCE